MRDQAKQIEENLAQAHGARDKARVRHWPRDLDADKCIYGQIRLAATVYTRSHAYLDRYGMRRNACASS